MSRQIRGGWTTRLWLFRSAVLQISTIFLNSPFESQLQSYVREVKRNSHFCDCRYLLSTLELLVRNQEYIVVFFNGSVSNSRLPSTSWLRKSHQQIPRHLRKNLKEFYVVQSSFSFKTLANFTRMFLRLVTSVSLYYPWPSLFCC